MFKRILPFLSLFFLFLLPTYCTVITQILPSEGAVGNVIRIIGDGFGAKQGKVIFSPNQEAVILHWDNNKITVAVPLGASTGKVSVVTPRGELAECFFSVCPSWSIYPAPIATSLVSISLPASNVGWAVESSGKTGLLRFNGDKWENVVLPNLTSMSDVFFLTPQNGWIVGDRGSIFHYQNGRWIDESGITSSKLNAVHFLTPKFGWAVGEGGVIIHYYDWTAYKVEWRLVDSPTRATLYGIYCINPKLAWAVGEDGTILKFSKDRWTVLPSPTGDNLRDISFSKPTDGWIVGHRGTIMHWNGFNWQLVYTQYSFNLYGVKAVSPEDAWAVGEKGLILHFNGVNWSASESPTTNTLYTVDFSEPKDGWVAGEEGTLLRYH